MWDAAWPLSTRLKAEFRAWSGGIANALSVTDAMRVNGRALTGLTISPTAVAFQVGEAEVLDAVPAALGSRNEVVDGHIVAKR